MPGSSKSGTFGRQQPRRPVKHRPIAKSGRHGQDEVRWTQVFANLSPWGYTKLLLSLIAFAVVVTWGVSRWAYLSGYTLHSEAMQLHRKTHLAPWNERLDGEIERLDQRYNLSFMQRRKARKIYSRYYLKFFDEFAKKMLSEEAPTGEGFWQGIMEECDREFERILSKKQLLRGRPR